MTPDDLDLCVQDFAAALGSDLLIADWGKRWGTDLILTARAALRSDQHDPASALDSLPLLPLGSKP